MIIVDTNVLSEMMNPVPDPTVVAWFSQVTRREQAVAATVAAELWAGAAIRPDGRKRRLLQARIEAALIGMSVLPFDETAARHYADVMATRKIAGRPITSFDAQIAATARAHDTAIATRNIRDFDGCGIKIINPWDHRP